MVVQVSGGDSLQKNKYKNECKRISGNEWFGVGLQVSLFVTEKQIKKIM